MISVIAGSVTFYALAKFHETMEAAVNTPVSIRKRTCRLLLEGLEGRYTAE